MRVIEQARPALLVCGPVYKMLIDRGERGEQLYSTVTGFLDRVRERHGCALWLEHHAPLQQGARRELRPIGSALWTRWPEYGIGLRPSIDATDPKGTLLVEQFRGAREGERKVWPEKLYYDSPWPWKGRYAAGTFTP
jgi:replicative DNA helicase